VILCLLFFFIFAGTTAAFADLPRIAAPILVSPIDQALLVNLPRTTTLAWTPVAGAASYTVDVYYKATASATYPTTPTFTVSAITVAEVELTGTELTADGYYKWTVTTIPTNTTKFEDSNPSSPFHFIYSTIFTLETPARISPAKFAHFHGDGASPQMTLQWSARPAVGANGYEVYVEGPYDAKTQTWPPVTGSPFSVATSGGGLTYQNSSYSFIATATGAYRWAARSIGDGGKTTNDSPAPDDTIPGDWYVFYFQK